MTDNGFNTVLHYYHRFRLMNVDNTGRDCLYCVRTCGNIKICGTHPWTSLAKGTSVMIHSIVDSIYHYSGEDDMGLMVSPVKRNGKNPAKIWPKSGKESGAAQNSIRLFNATMTEQCVRTWQCKCVWPDHAEAIPWLVLQA